MATVVSNSGPMLAEIHPSPGRRQAVVSAASFGNQSPVRIRSPHGTSKLNRPRPEPCLEPAGEPPSPSSLPLPELHSPVGPSVDDVSPRSPVLTDQSPASPVESVRQYSPEPCPAVPRLDSLDPGQCSNDSSFVQTLSPTQRQHDDAVNDRLLPVSLDEINAVPVQCVSPRSPGIITEAESPVLVPASPRSSPYERKSRSVSPPADGPFLLTNSSPVPNARKRSSPLVQSEWRSSTPVIILQNSPRHANDYRHCIVPEKDICHSRRAREDTYNKLFGKPESESTTAKPSVLHHKQENTQATLFGPPPAWRPTRRVCHTDTHNSLFGPPPALAARRKRSPYQDSPDLLCHDPTAKGHKEMSIEKIKTRYPLRFQNTGEKLFGGPECLSLPAGRSSNVFFDAAPEAHSRMPPPAEPVAN